MMKPGHGGTQGSVKKGLYQAGLSDAAVEQFYQQWRDNFIAKADIDFIAQQGFNCIRLPLHYDLFLTPAQRAVRNGVIRGTVPYADYVAALTKWQRQGELFRAPQQLEAIRLIDKMPTNAARAYKIRGVKSRPRSSDRAGGRVKPSA